MVDLEESKALGRRIVEEFLNRGCEGVVDELFSPHFLDHGGPFGVVVGRDGIKHLVEMLRRAFHDLHFDIEHLIAEEDKLVLHLRGSGTHKGEFMGKPPTGKRIAFRSVTILRIQESKVLERWNVFDLHGIMSQIEGAA